MIYGLTESEFAHTLSMSPLVAEEIAHYGKLVSALVETIRLMAEVDGVIDVNGGRPVK